MAQAIGSGRIRGDWLPSYRILDARMGEEEYRVFVHVPPRRRLSGEALPLICVLDGNALFRLSVDTLALQQAALGLGAIVVGIGHPGREPLDPRRMYDCTAPVSGDELPFFAAPDPDLYGGVRAFQDFVLATLGEVETTLPIKPSRRLLVGYSITGTMVLDLFLNGRDRRFDAYAAISPALWWKRGYLQELALARAPPPGRVRIAVGSLEATTDDPCRTTHLRRLYEANRHAFAGKSEPDSLAEMRRILAEQDTLGSARRLAGTLRSAGTDSELLICEGATHFSTPPQALARLSDWFLETI